MGHAMTWWRILAGTLAAGLFVSGSAAGAQSRLDRISHILVLYMENRSSTIFSAPFQGRTVSTGPVPPPCSATPTATRTVFFPM